MSWGKPIENPVPRWRDKDAAYQMFAFNLALDTLVNRYELDTWIYLNAMRLRDEFSASGEFEDMRGAWLRARFKEETRTGVTP